MSASRALLRMGARTVRRNRLRSMLIVALIASPVAAIVAADVLYRSSPLTKHQKADRALGEADAQLTFQNSGPDLEQSPDGLQTSTDDAPALATPTEADLRRWLPGITELTSNLQTSAVAQTKFGVTSFTFNNLDLSKPAVRPALALRDGRWAGAANELNLTAAVARRADLRIGDTVTLRQPAAKLTLVGIIKSRYGSPYGSYGSVTPATYAALHLPAASGPWLIRRAGGVSWADVLALNRHGVSVISRSVLLKPPPQSAVPLYTGGGFGPDPSSLSKRAAVTAAVVVGLGILQLALLAGPAFAVSARRRQRELALLASVGGERKTLRSSILAEGFVLGCVAAAVGAAVGVAAAVTFRGLTDYVVGPLRLPMGEIAGIAAVGVLSAVAGAFVPAHLASRLDVVAALNSRRGSTKGPWRVSILSVLALGLGAVLAVLGTDKAQALLVLPGIGLLELGILGLTPALLVLLGRAAPALPVSTRIALRDAARNRSAAVPALAAVLAATTASVAIAIYIDSLDTKDRLTYQPSTPTNEVSVLLSGDAVNAATVQSIITKHVGSVPLGVIHAAAGCDPVSRPGAAAGTPTGCLDVSVQRPSYNRCPGDVFSDASSDPRCRSEGMTTFTIPSIAIMSSDQLRFVIGREPPAAVKAALASGRVLLYDALDDDHGFALIGLQKDSDQAGSTPAVTRLPAMVWHPDSPLEFQAIMTPQTAAKLGVKSAVASVVAIVDKPLTARQEDGLNGDLAGYQLTAYVEHGYTDRYRIGIVSALIAAIVIATGATALATALAVVDSRPDLATLWAIGAAPGVRRRLSVARAGLVGVIGAVMGTALGFVPPLVVIELARRRARIAAHFTASQPPNPFSVPWFPNLIGTLLAVPLAAMLIAAVMTRARATRASA